jgi:hypothetical protein
VAGKKQTGDCVKSDLPTNTDGCAERWFRDKAEEAQIRLQLYLPFCSPGLRQVPNEIVRSALFTCRNRNTPRDNFRKQPIAVIGDGSIVYQGEELRQDVTSRVQLGELSRPVLGGTSDFVPSYSRRIAPLKQLGTNG